jgi:excinuclease ABC subunit A
VGTITEIYDYYRLLYTTIGRQYCPNHPHVELRKHSLDEIVEYVGSFAEGARFAVLAPAAQEGVSIHEEARRVILDMGYVRYFDGADIVSVSDERTGPLADPAAFAVVVDRLVYRTEEDMNPFVTRLKESLEISYRLADEQLVIRSLDPAESRRFSRRATCPECGYSLRDLTLSNFSFNSHHGACPSCHGLGVEVAFREEDIVNPELTLAEGAILPWTNYLYYLSILEAACKAHGIPMDVAYRDLTAAQRKIVLHGSPKELSVAFSEDTRHKTTGRIYKTKYEGVIPNMTRRYHEGGDREDSVYSKRIAQYMTEVPCAMCHGHRLKPEMLHIRVGGRNIGELADLSVGDSLEFFRALELTPNEKIISKKILKNVVDRLEFLDGVGLDYMTISRRTATLSGGESQRIRLATQIGTKLEGIIYVLDEPSIGLHPMDNHRLIANIRKLVDIGNTVIVVEHDEDIMRAADYIVDVGPGAGVHGGRLVFEGTPAQMLADDSTETGGYLSGRLRVMRPERSLEAPGKIEIKNAKGNNLKNVSVDIPLGMMTVVTGVSGSGKSTLVLDTLANAALNYFNGSNHPVSSVEKIAGFKHLDKAIIIDQSPIGKTPHSNVATYTGLFTHVREVFASTNEAQKRGYGPGRFSFNTK